MRSGIRLWAVSSLVVCGMWAIGARAQHANFVLFPDAKVHQDAVSQPIENTFVHPISGPYWNEDSFVTSDARLWYAYNKIDSKSLGGQVHVMAAQARLAITDQIQIVAYKDGFSSIHSSFSADGWNDVAAGVKWNFLQDWKHQFHAAAGVGYQFPWGESKVLQNKEELRAWASINKGFDRLHLGATFNYFWGMGDKGVLGGGDHLSWHVHADYMVCKQFSPVVEFNGYHVTRDRGAVLPIQGVDYTTLGGGEADNVITAAAGFEIRPIKNVGLRAAYEKDIVGHHDLIDYRLTVSAVIAF